MRGRLRFRSVKTRLAALTALGWLIPVLLLAYYIDVSLRTRVAFADGARYAAELSWERLTKTLGAISALPPETFFESTARPADVRMAVLEQAGRVQHYGAPADYSGYAANDRALLLAAMDSLGESAAIWGAPSGRLYLARGVFEETADGRKRVDTLVLELDRAYLLSFFMDNGFGGKNMAVMINRSVTDLVPARDGTLAIAPPGGGNPADSRWDAVGTVGTGSYAIVYYADMDKPSLIRDYRGITVIIAALAVICPLLALLSVSLYRGVTRPIARFMGVIGEIERGAFGAQMDENEYGEFARLARAFNSMSTGLKDALERARKQDAAGRDARLLALRAQINPHFLNNTLEFLNWKARMGDARGVSEMVSALSVLLEGAMGREQAALVPLRKELAYADAYLSVIAQRFGEHVRIARDVDPDALERRVPPLILQPLLENAVVHGVEPRGGGCVALRAVAGDGRLTLRVENDGELSPRDAARVNDAASQATESPRLGVRNVAERLSLLFGESGGLTVYTENGKTVAEVTMPG